MERIENHPILGETPKRKKVTFRKRENLSSLHSTEKKLKDMKVSRLQQR